MDAPRKSPGRAQERDVRDGPRTRGCHHRARFCRLDPPHHLTLTKEGRYASEERFRRLSTMRAKTLLEGSIAGGRRVCTWQSQIEQDSMHMAWLDKNFWLGTLTNGQSASRAPRSLSKVGERWVGSGNEAFVLAANGEATNEAAYASGWHHRPSWP